MEVIAKLKFLRQSSRKVKLIIDEVRGQRLLLAEQQLLAMSRQAAKPILKLIKSAAANAVNNFKLDKSKLFIKFITVGQGPVLKRYHPHAFGRASTIRKPSCHVMVVLAEKQTPYEKRSTKKISKSKFDGKK